MDERQRFDGLLDLLDELIEANEAVPVIVEGRRDVDSLRSLGLRGDVQALHSGESLFLFCERFSARSKEAILLTDWDRKGGELLDALESGLVANGVRVDRTFRDRLRGWMWPPPKDVESVSAYVDRGLARWHRTSLEDRKIPGTG